MKILRENQDIKDIQSFYYQQPLAVKWDETETTKRWYLGFYLNGSMDTTLKVDHLTPDHEGKEYWKKGRPKGGQERSPGDRLKEDRT